MLTGRETIKEPPDVTMQHIGAGWGNPVMVWLTDLRENTMLPNYIHFHCPKANKAKEGHDKWKSAEAGLALLPIHCLASREI